MKKEIKVQRAAQKAADLLASMGITLDLDLTALDVSEEVEIEADAVLLYYDFKGKHFTEKTCGYCNKVFATTNPRIVGRCSNACRAASLKDIGVVWNPYKSTRERWGNEYPLTLSPDALEAVKKNTMISNDTAPTIDRDALRALADGLHGPRSVVPVGRDDFLALLDTLDAETRRADAAENKLREIQA